MTTLEERFNQAGDEIARQKRHELANTLVEICEGEYEDILDLIKDAEDSLVEKTDTGPEFLIRIEAQKLLTRETLNIIREDMDDR